VHHRAWVVAGLATGQATVAHGISAGGISHRPARAQMGEGRNSIRRFPHWLLLLLFMIGLEWTSNNVSAGKAITITRGANLAASRSAGCFFAFPDWRQLAGSVLSRGRGGDEQHDHHRQKFFTTNTNWKRSRAASRSAF